MRRRSILTAVSLFVGAPALLVSARALAQMAVPPPPPPSVTVPSTTTGVPPTPAPANPGLPSPPMSPSTPSTQGLPRSVTSELRPTPIPAPIQVQQAQQLLTANGFYHGPIDGQLNGPTLSAVRAFQESARLPVTGNFDTQTTDLLNQLAPVTIGSPTATAPGTATPTPTTTTTSPTTTTTTPTSPTTMSPTTIINQTGSGAVTQPTTRVGGAANTRSTEQFPLSVPPPTPPFPESPLFIQP